MKLNLLNQIITIENSNRFIEYPYYDLNYASNLILVSSHLNLKDIDKDVLNSIILKGSISLLNNRYNSLGNSSSVVLDMLLSKIDITKDLYNLVEGKKTKIYK